MRDVDRAATLLVSDGHTCVLCRGDAVLTSDSRGVAPIIDWLSEGVDMTGFSVADRVTGRAVALLYAACGLVQAYSVLASEPAIAVCTAHGIGIKADQLVPQIMNRDGDGPCPMELVVAGIDDPAQAAQLLEAALISKRRANGMTGAVNC